MRLSLIILCIVLFAAAAGRYRAEASLRAVEREVALLEAERVAKGRAIQMLRAEIASLENPDRLARLAQAHTTLEPLSSAQFLTADDFLLALGDPSPNDTAEIENFGGDLGAPSRVSAPTAVASAAPPALN
ncbi:MAG: hypothetical protein AAFX08_01335 [Pseudomonadota bacterium]